MGTLRFNAGEKAFLNKLKSDSNIKFPLNKVVTIADKAFMLVQVNVSFRILEIVILNVFSFKCVLGGVSLYNAGNSLLVMEAANVMSNICRVTKCKVYRTILHETYVPTVLHSRSY